MRKKIIAKINVSTSVLPLLHISMRNHIAVVTLDLH